MKPKITWKSSVTDLHNINLHALERNLLHQIHTLFFIFSKSHLYSDLRYFRSFKVKHGYFNPDPSWLIFLWKFPPHAFTLSATLQAMMENFAWFIFIPIAFMNNQNMYFRDSRWDIFPSKKTKIFSTNNKGESLKHWHISIPLKSPRDFESMISFLSPFATRKKGVESG